MSVSVRLKLAALPSCLLLFTMSVLQLVVEYDLSRYAMHARSVTWCKEQFGADVEFVLIYITSSRCPGSRSWFVYVMDPEPPQSVSYAVAIPIYYGPITDAFLHFYDIEAMTDDWLLDPWVYWGDQLWCCGIYVVDGPDAMDMYWQEADELYTDTYKHYRVLGNGDPEQFWRGEKLYLGVRSMLYMGGDL